MVSWIGHQGSLTSPRLHASFCGFCCGCTNGTPWTVASDQQVGTQRWQSAAGVPVLVISFPSLGRRQLLRQRSSRTSHSTGTTGCLSSCSTSLGEHLSTTTSWTQVGITSPQSVGPAAKLQTCISHSVSSCAQPPPGPRLGPQVHEAWAPLPCCRHVYLDA